MGVKVIGDLVAYQFAREFKLEVYRLLSESRDARADRRFFYQIREAANGVEGNISEGYHRRNPAECVQFVRYALGSLGEARTRLQDGIDSRYFAEPDCRTAATWADRCFRATTAFLACQQRLAAEQRKKRRRRR